MLLQHAASRNQLALTEQGTYNSLINTFNRESGEPITQERVRRYFENLKARGYRSSTLHCAKAAIKKGILLTFPEQANDVRFLSFLDTMFRSIKCGRPERTVHREKILSQEEIKTLLERTPEKLSVILQTLSATAMRISELTGIRISDCRSEGNSVIVNVTGKGYRQRRIFLSTELHERIRTVFDGKTFLFENGNGKRYCRKYLWREVHKHGKDILGRRVTNHQFRHSWATFQLVQKQKSLKSISTYLGHHSVQLTSAYYIHDELKFEDVFAEAN